MADILTVWLSYATMILFETTLLVAYVRMLPNLKV